MRAATYPPWFFERLRTCVLHGDWRGLDDLVAGDSMMSSMRGSLGALISGKAGDRKALDVNRALVQRYFEMWNTGAGALADELLGATYRDHAQPSVLGPAALRSLVPRFRAAYPSRYTIAEIIAAGGDLVVVMTRIRGTPAAADVATQGLSFFRVADGKLAEHWSVYA